MDVGATVAFEFTGAPPFAVDYTEQRDRQRATRQSKRFATHHAEIVLQPDQEGQYIYVSLCAVESANVPDFRHLE